MNWKFIAAGVAGLGIGVLILNRYQNASEAEWMARVLLLEAGDIGPSEEWVAIMQVARNRARSGDYPDTVREVVSSLSWPGGGARGQAFVEKVVSSWPLEHPRWDEAFALARRMVAGEIANPIGTRTHFFHPGGMPSCAEEGAWNESGTRYCIEGRWWPSWSLPGRAEQEPIRIGRAIFT